jgi:hypothetical protein
MRMMTQNMIVFTVEFTRILFPGGGEAAISDVHHRLLHPS